MFKNYQQLTKTKKKQKKKENHRRKPKTGKN